MIHRSCYVFLALLTLFVVAAKAQKFDTVSVYFETNVSADFAKQAIDSLTSSIKYTSPTRVIGYADYVGDTEHNKHLSEDRAKSVAKYVSKSSGGKLKVSQIKGGGELPKKGGEASNGDPSGRRVDIIVELEPKGFQKDPELISPQNLEALEIDTTKEANIVLQGVGFIPGRHYPLPESQPQLERLLLTMQKYPTLRIEIQGFICCDYTKFDGMDNDTGGMNLSENRAKFIYDYLIREGIDPSRLSYKGYGSSKPKVFPEVTEADRQENRRVEIKVLK